MDDIYENFEEYHPYKKCNTLILFDDMIADMISNKKTSVNSNRIIYPRLKTKNLLLCSLHILILLHRKVLD